MLRHLMRAAALCAALCALGAIAAPSAFGAAGEFTIGTSPATITGSQSSTIIIAIKNVSLTIVLIKCSVVSLEGTSSTASGRDLTLTSTSSGCTLGGLAATLHMNGCKYTLTGSAERTALLDIVGCTTGKTITATKGNCTIAIGEQAGLSHVVFTSEGTASTMDALANLTITGLKSTQTGSECPAPGATQSDGTISGTVTFKAFSDAGSRSATRDEHTYTEVICGTQVSFTVD